MAYFDMDEPLMSRYWGGLLWTPWIKFTDLDKDSLPRQPGIYRVRPVGKNFLMYIGQTSRTLDVRVRKELAETFLKAGDEMPFNDPHTAAQSLWVWAREEGWEYECSVAPVDMTKDDTGKLLETWESFLLWLHRIQTGDSTLCNFGKFHPEYTRSRNRRTGIRGARITDGSRNPAGLPSVAPIKSLSDLHWSEMQFCTDYYLNKVPNVPGVYVIQNMSRVQYVGQSKHLRDRLKSHCIPDHGYLFQYCALYRDLHHQLLEIENDVIALHIKYDGRPPEHQFEDYKFIMILG